MLGDNRMYVLKKEAVFNDRKNFMSETMLKYRIFYDYRGMCSRWMTKLGKKADPIRKNINSNHDNKFYWQELKRKCTKYTPFLLKENGPLSNTDKYRKVLQLKIQKFQKEAEEKNGLDKT